MRIMQLGVGGGGSGEALLLVAITYRGLLFKLEFQAFF